MEEKNTTENLEETLLKTIKENPELTAAMIKYLIGELNGNQYALQEAVAGLKEAKIIMEENEDKIQMFRHEVRTPLVAILGYLQLIKKGKMPNMDNACEIMLASATKLKKLTGLLETSFSSQGTMNLSSKTNYTNGHEYINLEDFFERQGRSLEPDLNKYGIALRIRYNKVEKEPIIIWADYAKMEATIGTLLGNSLNKTPQDKKIKTAFRIYYNKLEIRIENPIEGGFERKVHGEGMGRGIQFALDTVRELKGTMENYFEPRIDQTQYFANIKLGFMGSRKSNPSEEMFGVEMKIDMDKLRQ